MTVPVLKRPLAEAQIKAWVAQFALDRGEPTAARFLQAIQSTCDRFARFPESGRNVRHDGDPELAGLQVTPIPGFRHFMMTVRFTGEAVEVLEVYHGARNKPYRPQ